MSSSVTDLPCALRTVQPAASEHYRTCVPLVPLHAAAGGFGTPFEDLSGDCEWVEIDTQRKLGKGMFVAKVEGNSMKPMIPSGSFCLFRGPVEGSRDGKTLLVRLRDAVDPETGERFTVKRYRGEKEESDDGTWRHKSITLSPVNPEFAAIVLEGDDDDRIDVVAELIEVLE